MELYLITIAFILVSFNILIAIAGKFAISIVLLRYNISIQGKIQFEQLEQIVLFVSCHKNRDYFKFIFIL